MKKRYGIVVIVVLLLAVGVGVYVYFNQDIQLIRSLTKQMDFTHFTYEMTVELDESSFSEEQVQLLSRADSLTGSTLMEHPVLHLSGGVADTKIYTQVFTEGMEAPLTELYFSDEKDLLNGAMFYQAVRKKLMQKSSLLEYLLPDWNDHQYVTFEQMEQMFGLNLQAASRFSLAMPKRLGVEQVVAGLAELDREELPDGTLIYRLEREDLSMELTFREDGTEPLSVHCTAVHPAEQIAEIEVVLAKLGLFIDSNSFKSIKSVELEMIPNDNLAIYIPDDTVSQEIVNGIEKIRSFFQE